MRWIAAIVGDVLDYRRSIDIVQRGDVVESTWKVHLLGRAVAQGTQIWPTSSLLSARLHRRFNALPIIFGLLCLSIGVIGGGVWMYDGILSGDAWVVLSGSAFLGLGAGIDVALSLGWPPRTGRVQVDLTFADRRSLHIGEVTFEQAEGFLKGLEDFLHRRHAEELVDTVNDSAHIQSSDHAPSNDPSN